MYPDPLWTPQDEDGWQGKQPGWQNCHGCGRSYAFDTTGTFHLMEDESYCSDCHTDNMIDALEREPDYDAAYDSMGESIAVQPESNRQTGATH